jgi:F0F1-type ATP synthase membrane subunit c/vacuolar-type H+-ATPase subunit K
MLPFEQTGLACPPQNRLETIQMKSVGAGIAIGTAIGVGIGVAIGNIGAGIAIGIAIGAAAGASRQKKSDRPDN